MNRTGATTEAARETPMPRPHTIAHQLVGNSRSSQYSTSTVTNVNPYPKSRLFASSNAQPRHLCFERPYRTSRRCPKTENGRPASQSAKYRTVKYAKTVHQVPSEAQSRSPVDPPRRRHA